MSVDSAMDKAVADLQERNALRRQTMRRRWRRRAKQLIADITQFGRDDANCGSWDPRDMDVFLGMKATKRARFEAAITKLAKEIPDGI